MEVLLFCKGAGEVACAPVGVAGARCVAVGVLLEESTTDMPANLALSRPRGGDVEDVEPAPDALDLVDANDMAVRV